MFKIYITKKIEGANTFIVPSVFETYAQAEIMLEKIKEYDTKTGVIDDYNYEIKEGED